MDTWSIEGQTTRYCTHGWGPGPYLDALNAAKTDWSNQLDFSFGGDFMNHCGSQTRLDIYHTNPPYELSEDCEAVWAGCMVVVDWYYSSLRNGYYIDEAEIWINTGAYSFSYNGLQATAAHEFGHVYGLNEAYSHQGGGSVCNDNLNSIMDALEFNQQTGKIDGGCDRNTVNPGYDTANACLFYFMQPTDFQPCCHSSTKITTNSMNLSWTDQSPSETFYEFNDYYLDGGWQQIQYPYPARSYSNIARGDAWQNQLVNRVYTRPSYLPVTQYISCMFVRTEAYGNIGWWCFPSQYLGS